MDERSGLCDADIAYRTSGRPFSSSSFDEMMSKLFDDPTEIAEIVYVDLADDGNAWFEDRRKRFLEVG